jgi:hypothetical protein
MKISIPVERAKRATKRLKRALDERDCSVGLMQAGEAVARMLGHKNWSEFRQFALSHTDVAPHDDQLPPDRLAARRQYQTSQLVDFLGIPVELAMRVVAVAPPTGRHVPVYQQNPEPGLNLIQMI